MLGFQAGVSYSAAQTREQLLREWRKTDSQFRGATDELADTWAGLMSMFADRWFQFRTRVAGDSGFMDELRGEIEDLLALLDDPETIEAAQEFGLALVHGLREAVDLTRELAGWIEHNQDLVAAIGGAYVGGRLGSFLGPKGAAAGALIGGGAAYLAAGAGSDGEIERLERLRDENERRAHSLRTIISRLERVGIENEEIARRRRELDGIEKRLGEIDAEIRRLAAAAAHQSELEPTVPVPPHPLAGAKPVAGSSADPDGTAASDKQAERYIDQLKRALALHGELGHEQAALHELERGRFKEATAEQREELLALARRLDLLEAVKSETQALAKAREEARANYLEAVEDIRAADFALVSPYERARAEIKRWLAETLKALEAGAAGHEDYAGRVAQAHAIAAERLRRVEAEEAEERLRASKHWQDGVIRGLKDVADESTDAAAAMEDATTRAFSGMEDALVAFVRTGKLSFSDLVDSIIADIARMTIRQSITGPLADALGSILKGIFSPGPGGPYAGAAPGTAPLIPVYSAPLPAPMRHSGGIAGSLGGVRRYLPPEVFAHAPRYHRGGLAGMLRPDEVPIIAQTGERILSRAETQALGQPPAIDIKFVNQGTPQQEIDREVRFDGARAVVTIFLADLENHGAISQGFEGAYGIRRAGI